MKKAKAKNDNVVKLRLLICSICSQPIKPEPHGWAGGHNAQPVNNGRCCSNCNAHCVIPMRIALLVTPPNTPPG